MFTVCAFKETKHIAFDAVELDLDGEPIGTLSVFGTFLYVGITCNIVTSVYHLWVIVYSQW